MSTLHTFRELRLDFQQSSGTSGKQGDGVQGTGPDRERGIRSASVQSWRSRDVSAVGEFPRSATQSNGRMAGGIPAIPGKAGRIRNSCRFTDVLRWGSGMRIAGTGGRIHPHGLTEHARMAGRNQGVRVAGSGIAAVGVSSAGVFPQRMWRSAQPEGEAGSLSFHAGVCAVILTGVEGIGNTQRDKQSIQRECMNTIRTLALGITLLVAIFLATSCRDDAPPVSPDPLSAGDTTSHDFVWDFDTLGLQYSGITSVAAVSANDVWVTGKFFMNDSNGVQIPAAVGNVAHWDGKAWTFKGFNSGGLQSWYLMADAFVRGADNLWLCGGSPFQWDGAKWITHKYGEPVRGDGIVETWATLDAKYACVISTNNFCFYYRHDDPVFRKVNLPNRFDEDCLDVVGLEDGTMFVGAGSRGADTASIYRISPIRQAKLYHKCPDADPYTLWMMNGTLHYGANRTIYRIDNNNPEQRSTLLTASESIIEEDHDKENHMIVMMHSNTQLHYNGSTWQEIYIPYPKSLAMHDVDVCGRDVYFVAFSPDQYCIVVHGRQL